MLFETFRQKAYQDLKQQNFNKIKNYFSGSSEKIPKDLIFKINNFIKRNQFNYPKDYNYLSHLKKFQSVPKEFQFEFLSPFIKDPSKQGLDEKLQINFFNQKNKVKIEKLPTKGLAFDKDNLNIFEVSDKEYAKKVKSRTKTFDGIIIPFCYVFLKYIGESGGAQDNQIRDVEELIKMSNKYKLKNPNFDYNFLTIIDGEYGKSKIKMLGDFISEENKEKIWIIHSDQDCPIFEPPTNKPDQK